MDKEKIIESLKKELSDQKKMAEFYKAALYSLPNPIFIKDENLKFCFFNKSYKEFFDLEEDQYIGMGVMDLPYLSEEDRVRYHKEDFDALNNSSTIHYEASYPDGLNPRESFYWSEGFVTEDGRKGLVGEIVDISVEKRLERELKLYAEEMERHGIRAVEKSMQDHLTGLYNRRIFDKKIPDLVEISNANSSEIFVFIIDLDNFKIVNDSFGHAEGDRVLCEFANLLKNNIRSSDYAIRYGGDEFVLVLPGISRQAAIEKGNYICQRTMETVKLPDGRAVTCSMGISGHGLLPTLDACIKKSDEALYKAKEAGRNTARII